MTPATLKAEYDRILRTAAIDVMVQGADAANVADRLLRALAEIRVRRSGLPPQWPCRSPKPAALPRRSPA